MKHEIFIVTVVIYDHYDNNIWSDAKAFSDEKTARDYFASKGQKMLAEAQDVEHSESPDDYEAVDAIETGDRLEYYRLSDQPVHCEVKFYRQTVGI